MFISFDGIDGVGKSTQAKLFCDWLREQGKEVVFCRDPGSTPLGEAVREILLRRENLAFGRRAEMFLYMAARAQLVEEIIRPALAAGKIVVSDRFLLANVVYQGHAGGLDYEALWKIGEVATDGIQPDLVFVLDMSEEAAENRINRPLDHMESQGTEFKRLLRAGFLFECERHPREMVLLNADRSVEALQAEIRRVTSERLKL